MGSLDRREFVKGAAVAAATTAAVNTFAIDKKLKSDKVLKIALVGCGGRGTGAASQAMNVRKGVKIVALAGQNTIHMAALG